jgi:hypothetical protein
MRAGALALVILIGCGDNEKGNGPPDAPPPDTMATADPCNGLDDDNDMAVDEDGCPAQCVGFAHENHTYIACAGARSYAAAMAVCASAKANLVRVDDEGENGWLRERADERGLATKLMWVGGTDAAVEGEWRWHDGGQFWQGNASGSGTLYQKWSAGQPNDGGNNEDCLAVATDGTWQDLSCDEAHPFLCDPADGPR